MISLAETFDTLYRDGQPARPSPAPPKARCCKKGKDELRHRPASQLLGPVREGWSLDINQGGLAAYENINFCPWCGRRLDVDS